MIVRDGLTTWNEQTLHTTATLTTRKPAVPVGPAGLTIHYARHLAKQYTNAAQFAIVSWTGACSKMPYRNEKIYWRNCFACSKPMTLVRDHAVTLECADCDVRELGTINGRFHSELDEYVQWNGLSIKTVDHSKKYLPSPDVIGNDEPVPLAKQTLQREAVG